MVWVRKRKQTWYENIYEAIVRFFSLLIRPFIDFYFNYGLARASVMSYVLCANLIIFVYLFMAISISIDIFDNPASVRRLLELHFLWPKQEKILIKKAPVGFTVTPGDMVLVKKYQKALDQYCQRNNTSEEKLQKNGDLDIEHFSITKALSGSICRAIKTFSRNKRFPLTVSFFVILAIAYIALLLNIKTNLAESVSPLIWGNVPLSNRNSEIMKLLWRIPHPNAIKSRLYLFFMLPLLVAIAISVLFTCHKLVDNHLSTPYTSTNTIITALTSFIISGFLFTGMYSLHVSGISKGHAAIGGFIASGLWLGGRWLFTTFAALSLYRNLRNFAFVPIILTWLYYFCSVFLFGIYVAHTLENPNLSPTARWWTMRDISLHHRYSNLSSWVKLDFLCRLARSRYEEYRPPFIGINITGDTADEIAHDALLHPAFVRECILEMVAHHPRIFFVELEGNRQYCKLRIPPEEVNVVPILTDCQDLERIKNEFEDYDFGHFVMEHYNNTWQAPPLMLSNVYRNYKEFQEKQRSFLIELRDDTEEIFL